MAKCPACGKHVAHVTISNANMSGMGMATLRGVVYSCSNPTCQVVLSVGIDPIAIQADTINGVVKALRGKV